MWMCYARETHMPMYMYTTSIRITEGQFSHLSVYYLSPVGLTKAWLVLSRISLFDYPLVILVLTHSWLTRASLWTKLIDVY